jgi:hypothetical protein
VEHVAPGNKIKRRPALKGRNTVAYISAFQALTLSFVCLTRGDALRACPWLSYYAPLALALRGFGAAKLKEEAITVAPMPSPTCLGGFTQKAQPTTLVCNYQHRRAVVIFFDFPAIRLPV